jgi:DNA-binding response OmpR family regulator
MKRRILLVDDEVAVLLTMKAVLEISGFDVDTAASAREGKHCLRSHEYHMIITDMRMENDESGHEVIQAARTAPYHPAVALLTAFPVEDDDWEQMGADKLLLKPMHTRVLLEQIEHLFATRERKLAALAAGASTSAKSLAPKRLVKKTVKKIAKPAKKAAAVSRPSKSASKTAAKKTVSKKAAAKKSSGPAKKSLKAPRASKKTVSATASKRSVKKR